MTISNDLSNLFYKEGAGASSKAYFIKKAKEKFPELTNKDINAFLKDQEITQINKAPVKNLGLKITAKPKTFQIDVMYYRTGELIKPFLLLVDIMSRRAWCYSIPQGKDETRSERIGTIYKNFLKEVGPIEAIEGDKEFDNQIFRDINEKEKIRLDTSVSSENHISNGNKLGIIDRLVRTLKSLMNKYRNIVDNRGTLQNMIDKVLDTYNDSPNRGINNKSPKEAWGDVDEQIDRNAKESMYNDIMFNKVKLMPGETVRILEPKKKFDKEKDRYSKEVYEIDSRTGYSFQVIDSDGKKQRRRLKPTEIQVVGKVDNLIDRKRLAKDENTTKKVKTVGKLVRNEDLTVKEAKKAVKQLESQSLAPALSTRSSQRVTRSMVRK